ncbi:AAEL017078-PA [Aedes aegypti]|uniref:AAEL017078-PA n=1 Tax=Aedes aegypti TaxID=7159 RepID=J9HFN3_AEDAE|nr:AAEL017078-PA [Aedes aegypti]
MMTQSGRIVLFGASVASVVQRQNAVKSSFPIKLLPSIACLFSLLFSA